MYSSYKNTIGLAPFWLFSHLFIEAQYALEGVVDVVTEIKNKSFYYFYTIQACTRNFFDAMYAGVGIFTFCG